MNKKIIYTHTEEYHSAIKKRDTFRVEHSGWILMSLCQGSPRGTNAAGSHVRNLRNEADSARATSQSTASRCKIRESWGVPHGPVTLWLGPHCPRFPSQENTCNSAWCWMPGVTLGMYINSESLHCTPETNIMPIVS